MAGLPLAFAAPFVLIALVGLPALYYLLRVTPPRPRQIAFPPLRLLFDLAPTRRTPARSPWWLLLLRLALAAVVILAMAGPIWNPPAAGADGMGPLLIALDDGWPAAPTWDERIAAAAERVQAATRAGRPVALAPLSQGPREIVGLEGARALETLRALKPQPHIPNRAAALPPVLRFLDAHQDAEVLWIADGLENGGARVFAQGLAGALKGRPALVLSDDRPSLAIAGADNQASGLEIQIVRAIVGGRAQGVAHALDAKGQTIGDAPFDLKGERRATMRFDLPLELRNEIARVEIADERSAGARTLLDERARRRRVGVVAGGTADTAQPLLAPSYYLVKALAPFADVREPRPGRGDPILAVLDDHVSVIILADVGVVSGAAHDGLARFVEAGGLLIRFAGVRMASAVDDLIPVRLRRGGRVLGGSLSWETPKRLAPFDAQSPFAGLTVPQEVTISRQVLAEPEAGLSAKTWAALADGTPLVTAARRGAGLVALVHVTADTTWSNLPLSGLFVEMLKRVMTLAPAAAAAQSGGESADAAGAARPEALAPSRTLDGFGALGPPPPNARPIPAAYSGEADLEHPPGFYGPPDAALALNALQPGAALDPADLSGLALTSVSLRAAAPFDFRPPLVTSALLMLLADALASLLLARGWRGLLRRPAPIVAALAAVFALAASPPLTRAQAQTPPAASSRAEPAIPPRDSDAALHPRLAYVATGDAKVDETSQVGLAALSRALAARTSFSPAEPVGVDPSRDMLAFYPFLYWPIVADRPLPSSEGVAAIGAFMRQGGTIVFDTRDALNVRSGGAPTPEQAWLRKLLANIDVPELEPVPRDHVVTKTFYLLDSFVGRTTVGETWIQALPSEADPAGSRPARAGDSVSPLVITANDLAAAWAVNRNGDAMYPLTPGGARQREMAIRGGVNLVIYTLTGNYKADQVHVRDLLERLAH